MRNMLISAALIFLILANFVHSAPAPQTNPPPKSVTKALEAISSQVQTITNILVKNNLASLPIRNSASGTSGTSGIDGAGFGSAQTSLASIKNMLELFRELKTLCSQIGCDDNALALGGGSQAGSVIYGAPGGTPYVAGGTGSYAVAPGK